MRQTVSQKILLLILSLFFIWKGLIPSVSKVHSDFPNYYLASKLYLEGEDLTKFYDNDWFGEQGKKHDLEYVKFNPFPPITIFLMTPVASFSPIVAKRIWIAINLIILLLLIRSIQSITNWRWEYCGIIVLSTGFSLINSFYLGQFYLILTYLIFLIYSLHKRDKNNLAGALLSFSILIKYFPLVYLIGYLLNKEKKIVYKTLVSGSILGAISILLIGFPTISFYLSKVLLPHLNGEIAGQAANSIPFQSFHSLFSNLFNSSHTVSIATLFVNLSILSITAYFIFIIKKFRLNTNYTLSILGFSGLLLLPASASYHFLLLIFPTVLFLYQYQEDKPNKSVYPFLIIYMAIGYLNIGFTKFLWETTNPILKILCYPRLLLMLILFVYVGYILIDLTSNMKRNKTIH
jgi:hypothetical protein